MEKKHPSLAAQLMQRYNSGRTSHQTQDGVVVETGAVHGKAKKGAQGGNQLGPKRGDKEDGPRKGPGKGKPRAQRAQCYLHFSDHCCCHFFCFAAVLFSLTAVIG